MCKMNQQRKSCSSKCNLEMSWISMHSTERTRPEPTESEKKENKPNAAKILRAEKFDVSQQNKKQMQKKNYLSRNKPKEPCRRKWKRNALHFICCAVFCFPEENFVHFTFHIFLPEMFSSALNTLSEFHNGPEKQFWQRNMKLDFQQKIVLIL